MRPAALLLISALALADDAVYQAPSPEPTPAETLIVALLNRFRADPPAEAKLIVATFGKGDKVFGAEAKMFLDECSALKAMPPVVFNLQLLDAARKHSYYMIHNGLGHAEEAGKVGFTGIGPVDRMKAAGYPVVGMGEDAFAGARNALDSHARFIVDDGPGGPGGMQPGRGHRMNMIGNFREIGPGAVPNGGGLSVTHDLGSRSSGRLVGGTVFVDHEGSGFYAVGSGKGNLVITAADGSHATTWSSGAYVIELKSDAATELRIDYQGQTQRKQVPAGHDNVGFSWAIPPKVDADAADRLLAQLDKEADPASPAHLKAVVALALAAAGLQVDAQRQERIKAALGDAGSQLATAQQSVRDAFAGEPAVMRKLLVDCGKAYHGTAAQAWFEDAELAFNASLFVRSYLKQIATLKPTPGAERDLIHELEGARDALRVGEFASRLSALLVQVRSAGKS
jgi:hypothetical protein